MVTEEDLIRTVSAAYGAGWRQVKLYFMCGLPTETDEDVLAVKAYLFSLPAVRAKAPDNTLSFPFNQRWAMMFWSAVFNPDTRFAPDSSKSPEWNRGAYLAEALAHCGECHTPRNLGLALDNRKKFAGAITAGWRGSHSAADSS